MLRTCVQPVINQCEKLVQLADLFTPQKSLDVVTVHNPDFYPPSSTETKSFSYPQSTAIFSNLTDELGRFSSVYTGTITTTTNLIKQKVGIGAAKS